MLGLIEHADIALFHLVNAWCGHWALDRIVNYEEGGDQFFRAGVLVAAYWWFWFAGCGERRNANRQRIVAALTAVLVTLVLARTLATVLPFRLRPMYVPGIGYHAPSLPITANMEDWSSFPSDTAAMFFALSFGLLYLSPVLGKALMVYSAVWICLPRLYLGLHYPSDLIAGALLGIGVTWICEKGLARNGTALGRRIMARVARVEERWPQVFYVAAFALSFEMSIMFADVRDLLHRMMHGFRGHPLQVDVVFISGVILAAAVGAALLIRRYRPDLLSRNARAVGR